MIAHRFVLPAAAAAALLAAAGSAAAGGCCPTCDCAPVVVVAAPPEPIYLVNQGPVFTGPGHAIPRPLPDAPRPAFYPYVGHVFTGYPYGVDSSGGYPRGSYSPFAGYPYVDPPPGLNAPSYVKYRMGYRPVRYHRRAR
jgi:hypothetical protein